MEGEGTLVRADDLKHAGNPTPSKSSPYSLYFKVLVSEKTTESSSEFRVAICGYKDGLMFQTKGPIHDAAITLLEAKLMALKCGLTEALSLGINHIAIWCDDNQIFEIVMGSYAPEQENIALLLRDVQGIRKHFTSSIAVRVNRNQVEFAYNVGMEAISSKTKMAMSSLSHPIKIDMPTPIRPKTTCLICFDDINADEMFYVHPCRHMFCPECVKRHIEVRLSEGYMITCPHHRCRSQLILEYCVNILTPQLQERWEQRMREESIPVTDRVYCPNPKCSALMSNRNFYQRNGVRKCCVKCREPFCIKCKVPWHDNLSCSKYKRLHPNPTENDKKLKKLANKELWRQCSKCQQIIERSSGCASLVCRCGHRFCYHCGADGETCYHGHGYYHLGQPQGPDLIDIALISMAAIALNFIINFGLKELRK